MASSDALSFGNEFHLIDAVISTLSRGASDGIATNTNVTSAPSLSELTVALAHIRSACRPLSNLQSDN